MKCRLFLLLQLRETSLRLNMWRNPNTDRPAVTGDVTFWRRGSANCQRRRYSLAQLSKVKYSLRVSTQAATGASFRISASDGRLYLSAGGSVTANREAADSPLCQLSPDEIFFMSGGSQVRLCVWLLHACDTEVNRARQN